MEDASKKSSGQNRFQSVLLSFVKSVWKRKFRLLVLSVAVLFAFVMWDVPDYKQSSSGTITLSYGNAFKGLNPNGTRFNIYDFVSREMMEKVLIETGLDAIMTADELASCISIEPSITQSISKRYISNVYSVSLTLPKELPYRFNADNLLKLLLDTYHRDFQSRYALNRSVLQMDWSDAESMEYLDFIDLVGVRTDNLKNFLEELANETSMTSYRLEEESFRSLIRSVENFKTIYLDKLSSYVDVLQLFRDPNAYCNKLNYKCLLLERDYKLSDRMRSIYQSALEYYDESVISFVMVPMYDNKSGLYMARTDIGTDSLAVKASDYSNASKALAKDIQTTKDTMQASLNTKQRIAETEAADQMVREIISQMNSLVKRIHTSVDEYESNSSASKISCVVEDTPLPEALNLKKNVLMTAVSIFALCVVFTIFDKRKL